MKIIDDIDTLLVSADPNTSVARIPERIAGSPNVVCIKQRYTIDSPAVYNGAFVEVEEDYMEDPTSRDGRRLVRHVKRVLVHPVPISFEDDADAATDAEATAVTTTDAAADAAADAATDAAPDPADPAADIASEVVGAEPARPFLDGSWLRVFWNPFRESWSFASSQLFNGEIMNWAEVPIGAEFAAYMKDKLDLESYDKARTYFFVYSHPHITFDPSVAAPLVQFIGSTDGHDVVLNDTLNADCHSTNATIRLHNGRFVVRLSREYAEIKRGFRKDMWTIFAHFYAFPDMNFYGKQSLFAICPRMEKLYMSFVRGPYTAALLELTDYTRNAYDRRRSAAVSSPRLANNLFQIWKQVLTYCFPTHEWRRPHDTLRTLTAEEVAPLFDVQQMAQVVAKLLSERKVRVSLKGIVN